MSETKTELNRMPMLEHLVELRRRLMWSVVALIVAFGVCFYFATDIFDFLAQPLMTALKDQPDKKLIYTKLYEVFFTEIKIGFYAGAFLAFPLFAIQIWKFVAPGLYKNERKAFWPFLLATPFLFFAGGAMVYYFIMPLAWDFFASFQKPGGTGSAAIQLLPKVEEYLSLVMRLIFAFGLAFQLPVILTLLAKVGIVSSRGLAKSRKYAVVGVFAVAAIITPPDIISQVGLAIPILLLYEISILLARLIEKKRAEEEARNDAELSGADGPGE